MQARNLTALITDTDYLDDTSINSDEFSPIMAISADEQARIAVSVLDGNISAILATTDLPSIGGAGDAPTAISLNDGIKFRNEAIAQLIQPQYLLNPDQIALRLALLYQKITDTRFADIHVDIPRDTLRNLVENNPTDIPIENIPRQLPTHIPNIPSRAQFFNNLISSSYDQTKIIGLFTVMSQIPQLRSYSEHIHHRLAILPAIELSCKPMPKEEIIARLDEIESRISKPNPAEKKAGEQNKKDFIREIILSRRDEIMLIAAEAEHDKFQNYVWEFCNNYYQHNVADLSNIRDTSGRNLLHITASNLNTASLYMLLSAKMNANITYNDKNALQLFIESLRHVPIAYLDKPINRFAINNLFETFKKCDASLSPAAAIILAECHEYVKTAAAPIAAPATVPVAEPAVVPVAEPVIVPVAEPVIVLVAEPVVVSVAEPVVIPVAELTAAATAELTPSPIATPSPMTATVLVPVTASIVPARRSILDTICCH